MHFRIIDHADGNALSYLLADLDEREAVLVDPLASEAELIRALLDEHDLRLRFVLRTHVHAPDANPCGDLCRFTAATLVAGERAPCREAQRRVAHGEVLVFGNELLRVLETPGHTPGCVSYLWRDRLFCGDAFDVGGCAVGTRESDPGQLFDSLTQRIFLLPAETLVFPAHSLKGRTVTTIGEERRRHVRLTGRSRESFVTEMAFRRLVRPKLRDVFVEPGDKER